MAKNKKTIQEIVQKDYPEFAADVDRMSLEDLDKRLNYLAKAAEEVAEALETNEKLQQLRDQINEISGPFKDVKKAVRAKSRYVIALIKEKGGEA